MKNEELLSVLIKINTYKDEPLNEKLIEQILSIVMLNPLKDDRKSCQEQLKYLIEQQVKGNIK